MRHYLRLKGVVNEVILNFNPTFIRPLMKEYGVQKFIMLIEVILIFNTTSIRPININNALQNVEVIIEVQHDLDATHIMNKKFVKLFTQNFPYYLASFIFSYGSFMIFFVSTLYLSRKVYYFSSLVIVLTTCQMLLISTIFFAVKYIQKKNVFRPSNFFSLFTVFRVNFLPNTIFLSNSF